MIFPDIYVSVTLFLIPSLYGDLCKEIFEEDGLNDCNTTHVTNLGSKPESGKCNQTHAHMALVLCIVFSHALIYSFSQNELVN